MSIHTCCSNPSITQQRISATVIGAPQVHNRRSISNFYDSVYLSTFRCPVDDSIDNISRGIKFNPGWGMLNGEEFSWRKNFYHKPKAFINHYWNFSKYTKLKTAAYVSLGNGGGTSARGRGLQNQNVEVPDRNIEVEKRIGEGISATLRRSQYRSQHMELTVKMALGGMSRGIEKNFSFPYRDGRRGPGGPWGRKSTTTSWRAEPGL